MNIARCPLSNNTLSENVPLVEREDISRVCLGGEVASADKVAIGLGLVREEGDKLVRGGAAFGAGGVLGNGDRRVVNEAGGDEESFSRPIVADDKVVGKKEDSHSDELGRVI